MNEKYTISDRLILFRDVLIAERGNDRPWLFESRFWNEQEEWTSKTDGFNVVPESPDHIVIDSICTFVLKYYKNCNKTCAKINKNRLLDINSKGACKHLLRSREDFISSKEDYFIIKGSNYNYVEYKKYNSINYSLDFKI